MNLVYCCNLLPYCAGTLEVAGTDKIFINKGRHTTDNPKHNDYSYAVLLNGPERGQRVSEGWMCFLIAAMILPVQEVII